MTRTGPVTCDRHTSLLVCPVPVRTCGSFNPAMLLDTARIYRESLHRHVLAAGFPARSLRRWEPDRRDRLLHRLGRRLPAIHLEHVTACELARGEDVPCMGIESRTRCSGSTSPESSPGRGSNGASACGHCCYVRPCLQLGLCGFGRTLSGEHGYGPSRLQYHVCGWRFTILAR